MTLGIRYISAHDHGGYGTAGRRLLIGMKNAGAPFTWTPMTGSRGWQLWYAPLQAPSTGDAELDPFYHRDIPCDTVVLHLVPEYTLRWRQLEPDRRFILHTVWETDRLPPHWRFFLELADLVVVPSAWNKKVFEEARLRVPVEVLPHIAHPPATVSGPAPVNIRDGDFVFLAVDSWTARKNLPTLIRCYLDAFTEKDPVTLVVKTGRQDFTQPLRGLRRRTTASEVHRILRDYRRPARISLVVDTLSDRDLHRLHARANCFVSLSHAEGWGLGPFDAGAAGKPVIATGYGGALDYLAPDNAFLVHARTVPVDDDTGKPSFLPCQRWAEPDPLHASELMRFVFEQRDEAAARGLRLQQSILDRYSERRVTEQFLRIVQGCPARAPAEAAVP